MKTLITGATGFTGSKLLNKLLDSNESVRVIVRDKTKFLKNNFSTAVDIIEGDITDQNTVKKSMAGIDRVFHIAAAFRNPEIEDELYYKTHVDATKYLLESALSEGVSKFVHCSTVGVHGHIETPLADENYPFNPGDVYQESKLFGEKLVFDFYKKYKLPIVVIRPTAIYGPGDLRLMKLFKMATLKYTPLPGNGENFYHMVHVDDLTDAFILASQKQDAVGHSIIVGGNEILTLNEILHLMAKVINKPLYKLHLPIKPIIEISKVCEKVFKLIKIPPPIHERRIHFFTNSRAFDTTKAKKLLDFQPKINLLEGISETFNWYVNEGLLLGDIAK